MLSYGLISLLALATASSASPISAARRDSSLIPAIPPACLAIASNSTAVSASNSSNLTDTSSFSNVTGIANTTTTCLVPAGDLSGLNDTEINNMVSNCTSTANSTSTDASSSSDNSTSTSTSTATDASSTDTSTDSSFTYSATATSSTAASTAAATSGTTSDGSASPTDTSSSAPPASTESSSAGDGGDDTGNGVGGSSGTSDPSSGQFTANTTDPSGRRKRSTPGVVLHSLLPRRLHSTLLSPHRRLVQTDLPTIAQNWQDLCLASGGDVFTNEPCVNLAGVAGINALLSTGGVCDQQDNADNMIDFAKSPGVTNQAALIAVAIAYRQHPRNADDIGGGVIPSTPYCTEQPRNPELVGIVNEQLPGVTPGLFGSPNTPMVAFGTDGTCPAGQTPDVSTCSCS